MTRPRALINPAMRWESLGLAAALAAAGCATKNGAYDASEQPPAASGVAAHSPQPPAVIVTPATGNRGRITSVNPTARHVVVSYALGIALPLVDQKLFVYRAGLKVAELKVSKERIDVNLVADITSGECRVGDEVRPD